MLAYVARGSQWGQNSPIAFCAQLAQSARHRSLGGVSMKGATIVSSASRGEVPK
jgi:hypothetical protein